MQQKIYQCRYGLFVKLKPGTISHLPGQKRTWYFNGNKFTDIENKMLRNLVSHVANNMHRYALIELYDNQFANDSEDRLVLKVIDTVQNGSVDRHTAKNNLQQYKECLVGYPLPDFLK